MYLETLQIKNLKLIRDLSLDFTRDGGPRMWTVFLAPNGLCKTSVLRAIALAASGPSRASELANVPSLPDARNLEALRIDAEFRPGPRHHSELNYAGLSEQPSPPPAIHSRLILDREEAEFQGNSYYPGHPNDVENDPIAGIGEILPWSSIGGYGVRRELPQTGRVLDDASDDRVVSRLAPLFDKQGVIATGYAEKLGELDVPNLVHRFAERLDQALIHSGLLTGVSRFDRRGKGGITEERHIVDSHRFSVALGGGPEVKVPAAWLSQGYQVTISWIADLIGSAMLNARGDLELTEIEGLVLIDEIDLFLHPAWQVELVRKLKRIFPHVQFIATTHSPMLLPGLEKDELVMLGQDEEGNVTANSPAIAPKLLTGSELYDIFFGIEDLHPREVGEALNDYLFLAKYRQRNDEEERRLQEAQEILEKEGIDPGISVVSREP